MEDARQAETCGSPEGSPDSGEPAAVIEVSSPTCQAHAAADAYMGFLDRDTLVAELNTLLEAERAGARVAARLVAQSTSPELKALARAIQMDEAHWCRMLISNLRALQAAPSTAVGAFYERAMAIPDIETRFAFVNRGQAWVVRRLKTLLPQVRSDQLHADLLRMLAGHDHNITQADATLARLSRAGAQTGAPAPQPES